jgi:uncharacterized membrane protein YvbJ
MRELKNKILGVMKENKKQKINIKRRWVVPLFEIFMILIMLRCLFLFLLFFLNPPGMSNDILI